MRYRAIQSFMLAVSVLGIASVSSAAVVLDQNFDDTATFPTGVGISATGDVNGSGGRWSRNDATTPTPTPVADPAASHVGDQAMMVTRNGGGVTGLLGYRNNDAAITSGVFTFKFSVYRRDADSSFTVNVNDADNMGLDPLAMLIDQSGVVNTQTSGNGGYTTRAFTIPQGTWAHLEYVVDMGTGKYDLFGALGSDPQTQILDDYTYASANLTTVSGVAFGPSGTLGNAFYVDDVYLATVPVPEPASIAGLVVAGLAGLSRRRRS